MKSKRANFQFLLLLPVLLFTGNSCGVYSFTGTTITAETMTITNFFNDSDGGPPNLSQNFSDKLRDYYQQNTNLTLIPQDGELLVEGTIVGYRLSPVAPTSSNDPNRGDAAALTRLTISIQTAYVNSTDDEFDFDRVFSFYADYDSSFDLNTVEERLIEEIFDQVILDIFNASVANW